MYLNQIYTQIKKEKARQKNGDKTNSPHRLPPPIPPPMHILACVKDYSDEAKMDLKKKFE